MADTTADSRHFWPDQLHDAPVSPSATARVVARRSGSWPSLLAVTELVRAPAALTVPGDALVGAVASGAPTGAAAVRAACSVCLYWAGMALNDYADREVDAEERPHRPIPSGRVTPGFALGLAAVLSAAGLAGAVACGGRRGLDVAVPLTAVIWAYDLGLKEHCVAGPAAMGLARGLDVLMGAAPAARHKAVAPATVVAAHTLVVTALSRRETQGASPALTLGTLTATGGVIALAARRAGPGRAAARQVGAAVRSPLPATVVAGAALGIYAAGFARAQLAARDRSAASLQRAVAAGIGGLLPLQAALAARSGALPLAQSLLAAGPLARRLFRKVSPT
jgi:4-hydroxybenzoate polyprenyltransferase